MKVGKCLRNILRRFRRECWGPTATEYAVLLVLIIFGALAAISLIGSLVSNSIQSVAEAVPDGSGESTSEGSGSDKDKKDKDKKDKKKPKKRQHGRDKSSSAQERLKSATTFGTRYVLGLGDRPHSRHS